MATVDELLTDAIQGLELVRPAEPLIHAEVPEAALILGPLLAIVEDSLIAIRKARQGGNPEVERAKIRARIIESIQNLAVLKNEASL